MGDFWDNVTKFLNEPSRNSSQRVEEHLIYLLVLIRENVVPVGVEGAVTVAQHQDLLPGDEAEPHQAGGALLSLPSLRPRLQSSPLSRVTELYHQVRKLMEIYF